MEHGEQNGGRKSQRVEAERQQRRRRDDLGPGRQRRLAVDTRNFDPEYTYRFINDDPGRVHSLTKQDDWDIVTHSDLGERDAKEKGVGSNVEFIADRETGKRAILVRKRLEYYKEDKAKEQAAIDETVAALKRGETKGAEALSGAHAYVPDGGIHIRERSRG